MTTEETAALLFGLMIGRPFTGAEAAGALRCSQRRGYTIVDKLRKLGCLERARHGSWIITEKGRLASALAMGRAHDDQQRKQAV